MLKFEDKHAQFGTTTVYAQRQNHTHLFAHAVVDLLNHAFVQLTTAVAAVAAGAFLLVLPTEFPSLSSPEFKTGVYALSLAVIQARAHSHFVPICPRTQILNLH